jgi:hypothetical protein
MAGKKEFGEMAAVEGDCTFDDSEELEYDQEIDKMTSRKKQIRLCDKIAYEMSCGKEG